MSEYSVAEYFRVRREETMKCNFLSAAIIAMLLAGYMGCDTPMQTQNAQDPWVIRTDFSDDAKWTSIRVQIAAPQSEFGQEFYASVQYVNDKKYAGIECNDLVHTLPDNYPGFLCFIVDKTTLANERA